MKSYFKKQEYNITFIINPDENDIKQLNVDFRDSVEGERITDANLLYLTIVESIDYGDTLTYILYEKDGNLIIFSEGYNPDASSFEIFNTKQTKEEYLDILTHYENEYENNFFQNALKEHEYNVLNADIPKHAVKVNKKPKV